MIEYKTKNIVIESPVYNVDIIPVEMRNTHRFLLKFFHVAYDSDKDLTFTIYYKKLKDDTETTLIRPMNKDEKYFKRKLPAALLCREYRFTITGTDITYALIYEFGVISDLIPVGAR